MPTSWIRLFTAAFLIAFVIFPSVSADDDLIRLQILNINATNDDGVHAAPKAVSSPFEFQLDRMLEEHDAFQIAAFYAFAFELSVCAVVGSLTTSTFHRELPAYGGRAPPSAL